MPEVFFRESTRRPARTSRARWTVMGSVLLHGVLVLTILIAPVLGSLALPPFTRPTFVVFADARPVPPAPAPPPPATVRDTPPPVVPTTAPAGFHEERPTPAGPPAPAIPGGFHSTPAPGTSVVPGRGRGVPPETFTPPKREGPIRPGGHILPPARIQYVAPLYPPVAVTARREGTVVLEALIDETGAVRDVTVLKSVPLLDRAAIDAVKQWRYSPTRLNGVPVAILMTVSVTFTLR